MFPCDDDLDRLLASVAERYGDIVGSEAIARAFAVACRDAESVSRETHAAGLESIVSAFDETLKTELRRLLRTH